MRDTRHAPVGPGAPGAITAPGSVGYLNPLLFLSWLHLADRTFLLPESLATQPFSQYWSLAYSVPPLLSEGFHAVPSSQEAILEGTFRAWRKERRRMAAGENLRRFKGGTRKNSFNNRGLIAGAADEVTLPENFGAAR